MRNYYHIYCERLEKVMANQDCVQRSKDGKHYICNVCHHPKEIVTIGVLKSKDGTKYRFAFCGGCVDTMKKASDEKNKPGIGWAGDESGEAWETPTDES